MRHVIGGAGGKLNYLKLKGLKNPADYAKDAGERAKGRREKAKAQRAKDAELRIADDKKAAHTGLTADKESQRKNSFPMWPMPWAGARPTWTLTTRLMLASRTRPSRRRAASTTEKS